MRSVKGIRRRNLGTELLMHAQGARHAQRFGVFQRRQRVGGLAGLRQRHDERLWIGHRVTIAVLAGDFPDAATDTGNRLKPVTRDKPGVVAVVPQAMINT